MLQLQTGCIEKIPKSHSNALRHDRVLPENCWGKFGQILAFVITMVILNRKANQFRPVKMFQSRWHKFSSRWQNIHKKHVNFFTHLQKNLFCRWPESIFKQINCCLLSHFDQTAGSQYFLCLG